MVRCARGFNRNGTPRHHETRRAEACLDRLSGHANVCASHADADPGAREGVAKAGFPWFESLSRKPPWQRGVEKTTSTIALRATISGWRYIQHPPKTGSWRFIRQALEPRPWSLGW